MIKNIILSSLLTISSIYSVQINNCTNYDITVTNIKFINPDEIGQPDIVSFKIRCGDIQIEKNIKSLTINSNNKQYRFKHLNDKSTIIFNDENSITQNTNSSCAIL